MDILGNPLKIRAAALSLTSNFSALLKEDWYRVSGTGVSNQDPGHPTPILLLRKSDLKLVTLGRLALPIPYPLWSGSYLLSQPQQSPYLHPLVPLPFL